MTGRQTLESADRLDRIDVCICTYRRASLSRTLDSILDQTGIDRPVRVIVADNDHTPSALPIVEQAARRGLKVHYVHAPAQNISIARNACLEASEAPLVAFIDDDEVAHPDWLSELLSALQANPDLTAVFGPVRAVYPAGAPRWAREADFHSFRPVVTKRGVDTGYTSNAMIHREATLGRRFDEALGRSGGEDTDFFTRLHSGGARFAPAPAAIVFEDVAPDRLSMAWVATRAFRSGQTHARRFLSRSHRRVPALVLASAKCLYSLATALAGVGSTMKWRRALVRASLHAGAVSRLCGLREGRLYG